MLHIMQPHSQCNTHRIAWRSEALPPCGCSVLVQDGFSNSRLSTDSLFTFRFSRAIYERQEFTLSYIFRRSCCACTSEKIHILHAWYSLTCCVGACTFHHDYFMECASCSTY